MGIPEAIDFTDRIALVTGGAGGIGLSIAEALCTLGANVPVLDFSEDNLKSAAQRLTRTKGRLITMKADIADADAVTGVLAQVGVEFGKVDILVNNVGSSLGVREPFGENSPQCGRGFIMSI